VRSRDKRPAVAWALLLLILLFTSAGEIVADSGNCGSHATQSIADGAAPDTLHGGPGNTNHGDPDDFDFVPPIGTWIHALLVAFGH
jgi:hypothetical protein